MIGTLTLVVALALVPGPVRAQDQQDGAEVTRARLATILARYANQILVSVDLSVPGVNVAFELLKSSSELDPTEPATWRKMIALALATDHEELLEDASRQLLKYAPEDQRAQLARLEAAIDRYNTADERIAALEQLLAPEMHDELGPELSARLAFRLADLHRRRGDLGAFGRWLGESIAFDPTYSDAVGVATGFLKERVADHVAYVELLVGLLTADLTDDAILQTLNLYLLHDGAYEAAERMIKMRLDQLEARGVPAGTSLYIQLAIAQWGGGSHEQAMETIEERKLFLDNLYETLAGMEDPSRSIMELAQLRAPLPPQLAAIQAMLMSDAEPDIRKESLEDLVLSVDFEQGLSDMSVEQNRDRAERLLHVYWLLLWLDADQDLLATRLEELEKVEEISEQAQERIKAWTLLRDGQPAEAETLFRKDTTGHAVTQAGLAECLLALGRDRDAAQILLQLWQKDKSDITGLWARDKLEALLGARVPPSAEAVAMTRLVAEIPMLIDRVPNDPRLALSMRLTPQSDSFKPYDPVLIDVEISNNTPLPLAIDRDGPIHDLILLEAKIDVPYEQPPDGPGIIFDVGTRLRLMPFESLTVPVDLRRYWVGTVIDRYPLYGATIDLTAMLNFRMNTGPTTGQASRVPGLMGIETDFNDIRIDGQRVTVPWASRVIEDLRGEQISPEELVNMAMLTQVIASNEGSLVSDPLPEEIITGAIDGMIACYPRLDPVSQTWLLAVMARSPRLDPIWDMAMGSPTATVRIIQLMRTLDSALESGSLEPLLEDSTVIAGQNSDLPAVRALAEWIETRADLAKQARLKALTNPTELER
ncbi:MAG: hypothetical protein MK116_12480 [Phycisphaerales bacterium]|nr:hypothetical protein [Phycisphaerales bacterium]